MTSETIKKIGGQIAGVNLSSFLQMIEMEQKTCTINIVTKKNMGKIFFHNGALIDAQTIHLKHREALYDILAWENIVIEVDENESRRQDHINLPLLHLLMESARYSDENKGSAGQASETPERQKIINLQVLKSENFCLEIGIRLLVDFDTSDISFNGTLVGFEPGEFLVIKAPGIFAQKAPDMLKREGLIIKTLYKGTIYAFRSRLINTISEPSKLMFAEYPRKVEHHELRAHKRFKCSIVSQARVNEKERDAVIENISEGGCQCVLETFHQEQDLPANLVAGIIPFRCRFPASKDEVAFLGEIRNTRKKTDEITVGIKFIYPNNTDDVRQIITDYIRFIETSSERV